MQIFLYPPYHCKNKFIEQNFYNQVFIRIYDKFSKYNANFLIRGRVGNFYIREVIFSESNFIPGFWQVLRIGGIFIAEEKISGTGPPACMS